MDEITSRERVRCALIFESPDRAPRDLRVMPAGRRWRADELAQIVARFPGDFARTSISKEEQPRCAQCTS